MTETAAVTAWANRGHLAVFVACGMNGLCGYGCPDIPDLYVDMVLTCVHLQHC